MRRQDRSWVTGPPGDVVESLVYLMIRYFNSTLDDNWERPVKREEKGAQPARLLVEKTLY